MTAPVNPEGQTAQEVRHAALEEAALFVEKHQHPMWTRFAVAQTIRALASTPSPAKQEQKIASAEGTASQLGAAPATRIDPLTGRPRRYLGPLDDGPMFPRDMPDEALRAIAEAQPDARDAEIAQLKSKGYALRGEAARLTKELEEARAQGLLDGQDLVNLRQQVEDCIGNAQTDADGDGWITAYHFNTGSIHRLLAMARDIRSDQGRVFRTVGMPIPPESQLATIARADTAEAQAKALREALERLEWQHREMDQAGDPPSCPVCGGSKPHHLAGCWLRAILVPPEPKAETPAETGRSIQFEGPAGGTGHPLIDQGRDARKPDGREPDASGAVGLPPCGEQQDSRSAGPSVSETAGQKEGP